MIDINRLVSARSLVRLALGLTRVARRAAVVFILSMTGALIVPIHDAAALPCGTRDGAIREPTPADARFVLEAALGLPGRCGRCLCDVDRDGSITVRDAERLLARAAGAPVELSCPECTCTALLRLPVHADELTVADLDGDALADFVAPGASGTTLWRARGRGRFAARVIYEEQGYRATYESAETADFDGDGALDVLLAGIDLRVLINLGDGTFGAPIVTSTAEFVNRPAVADVNGDATLDVVSGSGWPPQLRTFLGNGDGTFAPELRSPIGIAQRRIALGRIDGDATVDVVAIGDAWDGGPVFVAFGAGDGTFFAPVMLPAGPAPSDVELADLDEDGRSDVVVADHRDAVVHVHYGRRQGGFEPPRPLPVGGAAAAVVVADVDGDGLDDLAVAQASADVAILRNGPARAWQPARLVRAREAPHEVAAGDVDGDRDVDLLVPTSSGTVVLLNRGDGSFIEERFTRTDRLARDMLLGHVDADAVLDLVTIEDFGSVSAYAGDGSGTFGPRAKTTLESGSGGAITGFLSDVEADGFADVVIERIPPMGFDPVATGRDAHYHHDYRNEVVFMRGLGNGFFDAPEKVSGLASSGIAGGDLNGDGRNDFVALVREPDRIETWTAAAGAGFVHAATFDVGRRVGTPVLLDADGDADLDLVVFSRRRPGAFLWLGRGNATFGPPRKLAAGAAPSGIAAGDVNGDGVRDLATVDALEGSVSLHLGTVRGRFAAPVAIPGETLTVRGEPVLADFDGDRALDLAFVSGWDVAIARGDGAGGFDEPLAFATAVNGIQSEPLDIVVADFDYAGAPDLLVSHYVGSFDERDNAAFLLSDPGNCLLP